uniref:Uncharacterized protein n=1 Tax=viral metagenome TaxID=1070528 RepID=A0A6M3JZG6_9ZZZZ
MVKITKTDYRWCVDCDEPFDFWKYDSIKDTDHEGHTLREVTDEEFRNCVKGCAEIGELGYCCFTEKHLDSNKNREYPEDVPPLCPSCNEFLDRVYHNDYSTLAWDGEGYVDKHGDGEIKCPECGANCGDVFEDLPKEYRSEMMQQYLEEQEIK